LSELRAARLFNFFEAEIFAFLAVQKVSCKVGRKSVAGGLGLY
jgi:hypothetical protein